MFRLLKNSIDIAPQQIFCFRPESNYASTHESKELIRENEMDLDLDRPSYPSRRVSSWIFFNINFVKLAENIFPGYCKVCLIRLPPTQQCSKTKRQKAQCCPGTGRTAYGSVDGSKRPTDDSSSAKLRGKTERSWRNCLKEFSLLLLLLYILLHRYKINGYTFILPKYEC